jgi:DHA1 family inner membrane transport protein
LIGKAADKYGKNRVFAIFVLLSLVPIFAITNLPRTPIPLVLVVSTLFFVCSGGRMIPAQAMITSTVSPRTRGSFMSINSSMQQLAAGLSSFVSGLIIYKSLSGELINYNYIGYIAIAASIGCIFIAAKIKVNGEQLKPE